MSRFNHFTEHHRVSVRCRKMSEFLQDQLAKPYWRILT